MINLWKVGHLLQVASYKPYFVKISKRKRSPLLRSVDPSRKRWCNISISYLPFEVGIPVSASSGLICCTPNQHAYYCGHWDWTKLRLKQPSD